MNSFVYILASKKFGTLYIGVTDNLERRIQAHKEELFDGFTKKYKIKRLVHYEQFEDINEAVLREKQLKRWKRAWKLRLIKETNPDWRDLFYEQ